ncbi:MAG: Elongation factor-like GTPase 1, partial [Paramarteilia canceri]
MIGSMRYMDFREDEQSRGITMKSACFSCIHVEKATREPYFVNFIDSPGHIDFIQEISVATNLADSALIMIDVIEGVCIQ